MAKKEVIRYIQSMLSKDYLLSYIRQKLKEADYTEDEINDALDSAKHPSQHHFKILFSLIGVLILILGGTSFMLLSPPKQQEFSFSIAAPPSMPPNSTLSFQRELNPAGRGAVFIRYEILSSSTNQIIATETERLSSPITPFSTIGIKIPPDTPEGNYILRAIAEYTGGKKVITKEVSVTKEQAIPTTTITTAIAPTTVSTITTTTTIKQQISERQIPTTSAPQNTFDILQKIRDLAETDESSAAAKCEEFDKELSRNTCYSYVAEASKNKNHCTRINDDIVRDECFSSAAKAAKDNTICEDIASESVKDGCYINFFLDFGDYSVCHRIHDENIRETCETLRDR